MNLYRLIYVLDIKRFQSFSPYISKRLQKNLFIQIQYHLIFACLELPTISESPRSFSELSRVYTRGVPKKLPIKTIGYFLERPVYFLISSRIVLSFVLHSLLNPIISSVRIMQITGVHNESLVETNQVTVYRVEKMYANQRGYSV